jgi:hypothetical protein
LISIKKNSASATIANTIIIGESASDTFYLPSISGSDYIVSEASDGRIAIGDVILSGNALPKTDSNDVKIEGVWQLSGFDFHKVGSDLVIVKSGVDVSKKSVGKVTVKNFPFENSRGGFGITLGKTADLRVDPNIGDKVSNIGYDSSTRILPAGLKFFSKNSFKTKSQTEFKINMTNNLVKTFLTTCAVIAALFTNSAHEGMDISVISGNIVYTQLKMILA